MNVCMDIFGSVVKKRSLNLNFPKITMKFSKGAPSGNRTQLSRMGSLNATITPTVQFGVSNFDININLLQISVIKYELILMLKIQWKYLFVGKIT